MRHRASSAVDLASGDGRCLLAGLAALLVASPLAQAAEAPPSPLPLHWALRVADEANPDIALQTALRDAAHERIRPAGSLEDPRFSYEASNMPIGRSAFDSTPLSGNQFGLRQKIPFPGLLGARREAARAGSRAADHSLENRRLEVEGAVERAWAELGFAQRALAITRRNIELLRQLAAIAEAKYRVGNGLQQDVLRAQVELTRLLEEELRREAAVSGLGQPCHFVGSGGDAVRESVDQENRIASPDIPVGESDRARTPDLDEKHASVSLLGHIDSGKSPERTRPPHGIPTRDSYRIPEGPCWPISC